MTENERERRYNLKRAKMYDDLDSTARDIRRKIDRLEDKLKREYKFKPLRKESNPQEHLDEIHARLEAMRHSLLHVDSLVGGLAICFEPVPTRHVTVDFKNYEFKFRSSRSRFGVDA